MSAPDEIRRIDIGLRQGTDQEFEEINVAGEIEKQVEKDLSLIRQVIIVERKKMGTIKLGSPKFDVKETVARTTCCGSNE